MTTKSTKISLSSTKFDIKKLAYAALCLSTILVPYLLLGPMEIYVGNILEFKFSWLDFVIPCIIMALLLAVLLCLIISFLPEKAYFMITNILTCIGLLSYIQAMFMNVKLVEADGNHLDFSSIGSFFYINACIWIAVITIFLISSAKVKKSLWKNICTGLSGFLVIVQLIAFISLLVTTDTNPNKRNYQFSGEEQFVLSENENILVVILDAYSNKFFNYACENITDFETPLKDFTYYANAESVYIPTFPALPYLLTGRDFYYAESSDAWFKDIWSDEKVENFYKTVHDKGYVFNLFTKDTHSVVGLFEDVTGKIDNAVRTEVHADKAALTKLITKMSAYKYVPYILKPYCEVLTYEYENTITYAHENPAFDNDVYHQKLKEGGFRVDNSKNVINVTHIVGLHNSTKLDESLETQEELMDILSDYIEALKEAGKYDESTVIITADHGKWDYAEYQPIMFVKRKNETHDTMQRTMAPVSHEDFMPTILYLIGANDALGDSYARGGEYSIIWEANI